MSGMGQSELDLTPWATSIQPCPKGSQSLEDKVWTCSWDDIVCAQRLKRTDEFVAEGSREGLVEKVRASRIKLCLGPWWNFVSCF